MPVMATSAPPAASISIAISSEVMSAAPRSPSRRPAVSLGMCFISLPLRGASLLEYDVAQHGLRAELRPRGGLVAGLTLSADLGQGDRHRDPDFLRLGRRERRRAVGLDVDEVEGVDAVGERRDGVVGVVIL